MTTPENALKPLAADPLRAALSNGKRPARPSAASTSLTFGWRALWKIRHVPEQLLEVFEDTFRNMEVFPGVGIGFVLGRAELGLNAHAIGVGCNADAA